MNILSKSISEYTYRNDVDFKGRIITRYKNGVLVAGIHESDPNRVCIGFSVCHNIDRYDYVDNIKKPGHGLTIASKRAAKWADREYIDVPYKIQKDMQKFIERCVSYYKDKKFPAWAVDFIQEMNVSKKEKE